MTTLELLDYANQQITKLRLGENGRLGTEFVVAYDDAGEDAVRLSDGQGLDAICRSQGDIDSELSVMDEWASEEAAK